MYSIVWKYKTNEKNQTEFEFEYGKRGTWSKLFMNSINYSGSYLYKSSDKLHSYLLIDNWTDRESYESFMNENKDIYENLSRNFKKLYETEEKIGAFININ